MGDYKRVVILSKSASRYQTLMCKRSVNYNKMNNWFLYLIRCKLGRLYTGITTDVERRFEEHKSGDKKGSKSLRGKAPLELVMKKRIGDRGEALKIEAKVKKLSKIEKEMLVDGKIRIRDIKKHIILFISLFVAQQIITSCAVTTSKGMKNEDAVVSGRYVFQDKCSQCHELPDIEAYPYTSDDWSKIVDSMLEIKEAAQNISMREAGEIKSFLRRYSNLNYP